MSPCTDTPTCLLCGSRSFQIVETFPDPKAHVEAFYVNRCEACNFLYTHPQPNRSLIGQYYEEDYSSWHLTPKRRRFFDTTWQRWTYCHYFGYEDFCDELGLFNQLIARVMSYFYSQTIMAPRADNLGRLLDIGCGSGQFLSLMEYLGWDIRGVEPSATACRLATERWGIVPLNGSIEDVVEREFDVVSMIGVIEHLYDPVDTLRKAHGLLRPGGKAFITTHDISGPGPRLYGKKWVGWEVPQHLYFFDQSTMRTALMKAGFTNVKIKRHFRSTDLFNTLKVGRKERYSAFLLARLFVALGLSGGMIVEAQK